MPVGDDTFAYRRRLPHLSKENKTYFVTFCTCQRFFLIPTALDQVLASCVHDHPQQYWLHCAVVIPDHVHLILTPHARTLVKIIGSIKGASAYRVNRLIGRSGPLWQEESFDKIVRRSENLLKKAEYIAANPVRAGLVTSPDAYRWLWRAEFQQATG